VLSPRGAHPGTGDEASAVEVRDDKDQDHDEEHPSHDLSSGIATRARKRPGDRESDERADRELTVLDQKADEQEGESNRARTEDKAREARKGREVRFGG